MSHQTAVHYISIFYMIWPLLGACALVLLIWWIHHLRIQARHEVHEGQGAALRKPKVDSYSHMQSPFHAWDPRVKIISLMLYVFCVGALKTLGWALVALVISLVAAKMARIPLKFVAKRVMLVTAFLGMFFVVMPLTVKSQPGDGLYSFRGLEFITVNPRGLLVAALAFFKATAIVVMTIPLFGTNPFPVTIAALGNLKIPQLIIQMILLSYRYLYVFANEMQRMATAMKSRGFRARTNVRTLRTIGNFVGVLVVRSFERTERVYDAMLSRGYAGKSPRLETPPLGGVDLLKGALWGGLGLLLVGLDRAVSFAGLWSVLGGG
jgi:cobalt/nickel transport system permease protein